MVTVQQSAFKSSPTKSDAENEDIKSTLDYSIINDMEYLKSKLDEY